MNFVEEFSRIGYTNEHVVEYILFVLNHATNKRKKNERKGFEEHHILPVSLFPEYTTNKKNLFTLTCKDHFIAHYLLVNATNRNRSCLFAFNQMRRVFNIDSTIEELAYLYDEHRQSIYESCGEINKGRPMSNEQKERISKQTKGTVIYKNPMTNEMKRIRQEEVDRYKENGWIHCAIGRKRTKESKQAMSNKTVGRIAYTDGNDVFWFHPNEIIPENLIQGLPDVFKEKLAANGAKNGKLPFYTNKQTGEQKRLKPHEITDEWIQGRQNFGDNGNPFKGKRVLSNLFDRTKSVMIDKSEDPPPFYVYPVQKTLMIWKDKNVISASKESLQEKYKISRKTLISMIENNLIDTIPINSIDTTNHSFLLDLNWIS